VETILLVEDDEDVRFLLSSILKAEGYSVLEAKDGELALEVAASHQGPINLVLTDLQMPRLGGRRLVETLLPANPGMKAMFMSGFGREDFPDAHAQGLPVSFLEKPFMPKSLVRQIRKVLDA
jgi:CheY-like chemotaxis protein